MNRPTGHDQRASMAPPPRIPPRKYMMLVYNEDVNDGGRECNARTLAVLAGMHRYGLTHAAAREMVDEALRPKIRHCVTNNRVTMPCATT